MLSRCNNCFGQYDDEFGVCHHCGYVPGDPAKELYHLYPGMILNDRYVVGKVLGFGGFGITYKAWDKKLGTIMAIKEYYPIGLVNRIPGTKDVILFAGNRMKEYNHGLTRFLDEARNMAKFSSHKSIVGIYEYFEEHNTAYIVMELLEGLTLSEFLKSNKLDVETSVELISHVCDALKAIHATGIIHRDVSPDNIFLCTNKAIKLIDFGAARFSSNEEKFMTIILKPGYAPPEQYSTVNTQGPWTDIYALGATMYLMVTGIKPEESTNRKIADNLPSPAEVDNAIPEYISNTIMKAMALDKHLRFPSVVEFEKALNQEKKVLPVAKEKKKRQRRRLGGLIATILVIVISASVFTYSWNKEKEAETLPDASIAMWYPLSGDAAVDTAKNEAFTAIVEAFNSSFPNVTVEVKTLPQGDYASALSKSISSGTAPALFESTGMDAQMLDHSMDLSRTLKEAKDTPCYFLDHYGSYFPHKKQLPLGFIAPAIYLNTTRVTFDSHGLKDVKPLSDTAQVLVINDAVVTAFSAVYGDLSVYGILYTDGSAGAESDAKTLFLSGEAEVYFSDTSDYFDIQNEMPARYKLMYVDGDKVVGTFSNLWSIGECDDNERKAAERLLVFMLSNYSQDYLHIRNRSGALPINKHVLEVFSTVYNDYEGFFDNIKNYEFVVQN